MDVQHKTRTRGIINYKHHLKVNHTPDQLNTTSVGGNLEEEEEKCKTSNYNSLISNSPSSVSRTDIRCRQCQKIIARFDQNNLVKLCAICSKKLRLNVGKECRVNLQDIFKVSCDNIKHYLAVDKGKGDRSKIRSINIKLKDLKDTTEFEKYCENSNNKMARRGALSRVTKTVILTSSSDKIKGKATMPTTRQTRCTEKQVVTSTLGKPSKRRRSLGELSVEQQSKRIKVHSEKSQDDARKSGTQKSIKLEEESQDVKTKSKKGSEVVAKPVRETRRNVTVGIRNVAKKIEMVSPKPKRRKLMTSGDEDNTSKVSPKGKGNQNRLRDSKESIEKLNESLNEESPKRKKTLRGNVDTEKSTQSISEKRSSKKRNVSISTKEIEESQKTLQQKISKKVEKKISTRRKTSEDEKLKESPLTRHKSFEQGKVSLEQVKAVETKSIKRTSQPKGTGKSSSNKGVKKSDSSNYDLKTAKISIEKLSVDKTVEVKPVLRSRTSEKCEKPSPTTENSTGRLNKELRNSSKSKNQQPVKKSVRGTSKRVINTMKAELNNRLNTPVFSPLRLRNKVIIKNKNLQPNKNFETKEQTKHPLTSLNKNESPEKVNKPIKKFEHLKQTVSPKKQTPVQHNISIRNQHGRRALTASVRRSLAQKRQPIKKTANKSTTESKKSLINRITSLQEKKVFSKPSLKTNREKESSLNIAKSSSEVSTKDKDITTMDTRSPPNKKRRLEIECQTVATDAGKNTQTETLDQKEYNCNICSKEYKTEVEWKAHELTHSRCLELKIKRCSPGESDDSSESLKVVGGILNDIINSFIDDLDSDKAESVVGHVQVNTEVEGSDVGVEKYNESMSSNLSISLDKSNNTSLERKDSNLGVEDQSEISDHKQGSHSKSIDKTISVEADKQDVITNLPVRTPTILDNKQAFQDKSVVKLEKLDLYSHGDGIIMVQKFTEEIVMKQISDDSMTGSSKKEVLGHEIPCIDIEVSKLENTAESDSCKVTDTKTDELCLDSVIVKKLVIKEDCKDIHGIPTLLKQDDSSVEHKLDNKLDLNNINELENPCINKDTLKSSTESVKTSEIQKTDSFIEKSDKDIKTKNIYKNKLDNYCISETLIQSATDSDSVKTNKETTQEISYIKSDDSNIIKPIAGSSTESDSVKTNEETAQDISSINSDDSSIIKPIPGSATDSSSLKRNTETTQVIMPIKSGGSSNIKPITESVTDSDSLKTNKNTAQEITSLKSDDSINIKPIAESATDSESVKTNETTQEILSMKRDTSNFVKPILESVTESVKTNEGITKECDDSSIFEPFVESVIESVKTKDVTKQQISCVKSDESSIIKPIIQFTSESAKTNESTTQDVSSEKSDDSVIIKPIVKSVTKPVKAIEEITQNISFVETKISTKQPDNLSQNKVSDSSTLPSSDTYLSKTDQESPKKELICQTSLKIENKNIEVENPSKLNTSSCVLGKYCESKIMEKECLTVVKSDVITVSSWKNEETNKLHINVKSDDINEQVNESSKEIVSTTVKEKEGCLKADVNELCIELCENQKSEQNVKFVQTCPDVINEKPEIDHVEENESNCNVKLQDKSDNVKNESTIDDPEIEDINSPEDFSAYLDDENRERNITVEESNVTSTSLSKTSSEDKNISFEAKKKLQFFNTSNMVSDKIKINENKYVICKSNAHLKDSNPIDKQEVFNEEIKSQTKTLNIELEYSKNEETAVRECKAISQNNIDDGSASAEESKSQDEHKGSKTNQDNAENDNLVSRNEETLHITNDSTTNEMRDNLETPVIESLDDVIDSKNAIQLSVSLPELENKLEMSIQDNVQESGNINSLDILPEMKITLVDNPVSLIVNDGDLGNKETFNKTSVSLGKLTDMENKPKILIEDIAQCESISLDTNISIVVSTVEKPSEENKLFENIYKEPDIPLVESTLEEPSGKSIELGKEISKNTKNTIVESAIEKPLKKITESSETFSRDIAITLVESMHEEPSIKSTKSVESLSKYTDTYIVESAMENTSKEFAEPDKGISKNIDISVEELVMDKLTEEITESIINISKDTDTFMVESTKENSSEENAELDKSLSKNTDITVEESTMDKLTEEITKPVINISKDKDIVKVEPISVKFSIKSFSKDSDVASVELKNKEFSVKSISKDSDVTAVEPIHKVASVELILKGSDDAALQLTHEKPSVESISKNSDISTLKLKHEEPSVPISKDPNVTAVELEHEENLVESTSKGLDFTAEESNQEELSVKSISVDSNAAAVESKQEEPSAESICKSMKDFAAVEIEKKKSLVESSSKDSAAVALVLNHEKPSVESAFQGVDAGAVEIKLNKSSVESASRDSDVATVELKQEELSAEFISKDADVAALESNQRELSAVSYPKESDVTAVEPKQGELSVESISTDSNIAVVASKQEILSAESISKDIDVAAVELKQEALSAEFISKNSDIAVVESNKENLSVESISKDLDVAAVETKEKELSTESLFKDSNVAAKESKEEELCTKTISKDLDVVAVESKQQESSVESISYDSDLALVESNQQESSVESIFKGSNVAALKSKEVEVSVESISKDSNVVALESKQQVSSFESISKDSDVAAVESKWEDLSSESSSIDSDIVTVKSKQLESSVKSISKDTDVVAVESKQLASSVESIPIDSDIAAVESKQDDLSAKSISIDSDIATVESKQLQRSVESIPKDLDVVAVESKQQESSVESISKTSVDVAVELKQQESSIASNSKVSDIAAVESKKEELSAESISKDSHIAAAESKQQKYSVESIFKGSDVCGIKSKKEEGSVEPVFEDLDVIAMESKQEERSFESISKNSNFTMESKQEDLSAQLISKDMIVSVVESMHQEPSVEYISTHSDVAGILESKQEEPLVEFICKTSDVTIVESKQTESSIYALKDSNVTEVELKQEESVVSISTDLDVTVVESKETKSLVESINKRGLSETVKSLVQSISNDSDVVIVEIKREEVLETTKPSFKSVSKDSDVVTIEELEETNSSGLNGTMNINTNLCIKNDKRCLTGNSHSKSNKDKNIIIENGLESKCKSGSSNIEVIDIENEEKSDKCHQLMSCQSSPRNKIEKSNTSKLADIITLDDSDMSLDETAIVSSTSGVQDTKSLKQENTEVILIVDEEDDDGVDIFSKFEENVMSSEKDLDEKFKGGAFGVTVSSSNTIETNKKVEPNNKSLDDIENQNNPLNKNGSVVEENRMKEINFKGTKVRDGNDLKEITEITNNVTNVIEKQNRVEA